MIDPDDTPEVESDIALRLLKNYMDAINLAYFAKTRGDYAHEVYKI